MDCIVTVFKAPLVATFAVDLLKRKKKVVQGSLFQRGTYVFRICLP